MLKIGAKPKDFSLKDKDGKTYSLDSFKTKYTVLYFYPKDDTPGCTIEANEFTKDVETFKKLGATIVGVSGGDEKTKTKFCEKYGLKILLLSDTDFLLAKAYGLYGEKTFMGKKYMGIFRTTLVLDKDKKLLKVFEGVKAEGHSKEVQEYLKSL